MATIGHKECTKTEALIRNGKERIKPLICANNLKFGMATKGHKEAQKLDCMLQFARNQEER